MNFTRSSAKKITVAGKSPSTLSNYSRHLAQLALHFNQIPTEVDPDQVNDYLYLVKLDYIGKTLITIREEQKALVKNQQIMAEGTQRKLATLDTGITTMENTLTTLVKQQERTRRLLMTIFFTGIVPLLAFITALVLKLWILT